MGHASKGMLVPRPAHAIGHGLLPFGTQRFAWPPGPSCFDGIRTRITPKTGHPDRLNDEAMLRIRCWKGGSVQTTEVQGPRLDHRSTSPQYGSGRVAALTSYSQVRCGSGRCIGHRPRFARRPGNASFPKQASVQDPYGRR